MRIMLIPILIFFFSCSTKSIVEEKEKYVLMNNLWQKETTIEDIKKNFGNNFKDVEGGIIYTFPNSKFPEMGFFLNASKKLREQFIFIDEISLVHFKEAIKCEWKETEEKKTTAYYTRTIKKGFCKNLSIIYETYPSLNALEVRWKK